MNKIDTYKDLLVIPYKYLLDSSRGHAHAQGGPVWPDWDTTPHRHYKAGVAIDWAPEVDETAPVLSAGEAWWAGACCNHFGHQVVDFTSKLALYNEMLGPGDRIAIATKIRSGMTSWETLPGFARAIYEYFGFTKDSVHVVSKPTRFALMHSLPQQEEHGGGPATPEHLAALERRADQLLPRETPWSGGRFYVSRSQMAHGGGIAGESAIEKKISEAGYEIIYPETLPLKDQLSLYRSAAELVFQEGSALHGLQLLGPINARVTVIVRRPGFKMLEPNLSQRISNLNYVVIGSAFLHGVKPNGKPADANGILIPDEQGLEQLAEAIGASPATLATISPEMSGEMSGDISAFLEREAGSYRAKHPHHMPRILAQLDKTPFAGLAPSSA